MYTCQMNVLPIVSTLGRTGSFLNNLTSREKPIRIRGPGSVFKGLQYYSGSTHTSGSFPDFAINPSFIQCRYPPFKTEMFLIP